MDDLISRQAALDWLEDEWDGMVVHVFDGIKNIPAAHCDNCPYPDQHVPQEDAVSRKELKHIFETWLTVKGYNDAERNIIKAALYELQFAPSVMPVQRSFSCGQENDLISRMAAIDALDCINGVEEVLKALPSAQPERTCVNCGRTVNNGGWYADGRTRCPIEEHYALPKDGFCHLWEKRNVTDDDYPRRTDKQTPLRRKEEGRAEGR